MQNYIIKICRNIRRIRKAYNQLNDNYKKIMLKDIVIESFEYDIFKEK